MYYLLFQATVLTVIIVHYIAIHFCVLIFGPLSSSESTKTFHLGLSNMEILIAVIDDGTVLSAGSDVAYTLREGKYNNQ